MEIKVPVLPESVADATIATWHVKAGEACDDVCAETAEASNEDV